MSEDELLAELEGMGLNVEWRPLQGLERGQYFHRDRLVVIRRGLTMPQRRCTLAHELVHAQRMDDGPQSERVERRVDQAASKLLISPAEYRLAETMYGPCVPKLAVELGVTQGLVRAYQGTLGAHSTWALA